MSASGNPQSTPWEKKTPTVTVSPVAQDDVELANKQQACAQRSSRRNLYRIIVVALLLTVALGVGLGVGLHQKQSTVVADTEFAASTTTSPTTTSSRTVYSAATTSSAPPSAGTASTSCPGSNGTTFSASGFTYTIYCGNDIRLPDSLPHADLGRVYQPTFDACIESCGRLGVTNKRSDVSAVYWVDYDTTDAGTCWCLGNSTRADGTVLIPGARNDLAWINQ